MFEVVSNIISKLCKAIINWLRKTQGNLGRQFRLKKFKIFRFHSQKIGLVINLSYSMPMTTMITLAIRI